MNTSQAGKDLAIRRGVAFIDTVANDPAYSAEYGSDFLWFFYGLATTSRDPELRRMGANFGRHIGKEWLRQNPKLPKDAGPDALVDFGTAVYAVSHLGMRTADLTRQMRRRAAEIAVRDYFGFDAMHEPPPAVSKRYDTWCDALITAQTGEINGVKLGVTYGQLIQWLPSMRPYPHTEAALFSITHLIYTFNNYSEYAVDRECFRPEFEYLRAALPEAIEHRDPEAIGECIDTLRAFGMTNRDEAIQRGIDFLLATQNADGSWGNPKDPDIYNRYHSTWTAVDALREYRFKPPQACPLSRGLLRSASDGSDRGRP